MPASPSNPPSSAAAPSLLRRIPLAFGAFFSLLGDAGLAARYQALRAATAAAAPATAPPPPPPAPVLQRVPTDAALQLLALLQRDARLIDFVGEDLSGYDDAQIGAAARVVHEGCAKVLREHFSIAPVRSEEEGSPVTLQAGFDPASVRLSGNLVGQPPYRGHLSHRGWRVTEVRLPKLAESHDAQIVAQAEVEL